MRARQRGDQAECLQTAQILAIGQASAAGESLTAHTTVRSTPNHFARTRVRPGKSKKIPSKANCHRS